MNVLNLSSTQSRDDNSQLPSPCDLLTQGSCATARRDRANWLTMHSLRNLYHVPATHLNYAITYKPSLLKPTDRRVAANKYKPSPETTPAFASSLATNSGLYSGTPHKIQCPDSACANTRCRYKSIWGIEKICKSCVVLYNKRIKLLMLFLHSNIKIKICFYYKIFQPQLAIIGLYKIILTSHTVCTKYVRIVSWKF